MSSKLITRTRTFSYPFLLLQEQEMSSRIQGLAPEEQQILLGVINWTVVAGS
jgi:hypothetical protein